MKLFREEYLIIQDDYLSVDPSREGLDDDDDDLVYSNDDLGENTEITPLGDALEEDDINDLKIDPDDDDDDDDDFDDDDDLDIDLEEVEEEDEILDSSQIDPDDDFDDDDDLLDDDDDDLDTGVSPDIDDDLLSDDDDLDEDETPRSSINTDTDFSSRPYGRVTGTMIDHEPGLPGPRS